VSLHCHVERFDGQMPIVDGADRPPHGERREQIAHDGEVPFAILTNAQLADVADPSLIRSVGRELLLQQMSATGWS
jgi:hypothetical protein